MAQGSGRINRSFLTQEEKENQPKITKALLLRIFGYLKPYWIQIIIVLLTIFAASALGLLPLLLTGQIIDDGLIGKNMTILIRLVILSLGVTVLSNLLGVLESYINTWIAQHISFDMRNNMFAHLQALSHRFYTTNKQGEIITRMTSDISGVESVITLTMTSIIRNVITLSIALVTMFRMNWILAGISLVIVPLFTIPTKQAGKKRWALTRQVQDGNDEINSILNETLSVSGQLLVKLFTNETLEFKNYEAANAGMVDLKIKESLTGRWFRLVITTFTAIGPMLIYLVGGFLIIRQGSSLTVGDITVMVALLSRLYNPINSLFNIQVDVIRSLALFTRIFEYLDLPLEVENANDAIAPEKVLGNLEFKDVAFAYDPVKPILQNISFSLKPGQTTAIVGPSGSGKSTLVNLLPRLYDVTGGAILLDGIDIRHLDLDFLRRNIAMVTQDTYLFNDTIRKNLLYAKPNATEAELIYACQRANIHDFIIAQPNGYSTVVGNRGLILSGGEKQRISIARAILKDPVILILDEATSSLDSISENLIQDAMEPLLAGRTSIVIAHRLSTIMAADEILVVKAGSIRERGTHTELLTLNGIYRELYETQFRRALDEQVNRVGHNP